MAAPYQPLVPSQYLVLTRERRANDRDDRPPAPAGRGPCHSAAWPLVRHGPSLWSFGLLAFGAARPDWCSARPHGLDHFTSVNDLDDPAQTAGAAFNVTVDGVRPPGSQSSPTTPARRRLGSASGRVAERFAARVSATIAWSQWHRHRRHGHGQDESPDRRDGCLHRHPRHPRRRPPASRVAPSIATAIAFIAQPVDTKFDATIYSSLATTTGVKVKATDTFGNPVSGDQRDRR